MVSLAVFPPWRTLLFVLLSSVYEGTAQWYLHPALPQTDTFNSSSQYPSLSSVQSIIHSAGLDAATAAAVEVAIDFERSNWAGQSVRSDPFYTDLPSNASHALPGSVLKVEWYTNTTLYTLPPNVALSRFLYQSENVNGTATPASAFVLWPWMPRSFDDISGIPVVAWAHGTSGLSGECGPSHIRNLWYHFSAPFTLALQGYAVVAPDYAGLGLGQYSNGTRIPHQYQAGPAAANDLIHAVQAAQKAFPTLLSREFVTFGHSQGGNAVWAAAQRQVSKPVPGYLGTVAGSPGTTYLNEAMGFEHELAALIAPGVSSIFPEFELGDWLTSEGVKRVETFMALQGCQSVALELVESVPPETLLRDDFNTSSWYWDAWNEVTQVGGLPIAEPMLVLQGTGDVGVLISTTDEAVNATCGLSANSSIEYARFEGADHVPTLYASQRLWLDWIQDRFERKPAVEGCKTQTYSPALPVDAYQTELTFFLEWPLYMYEIA